MSQHRILRVVKVGGSLLGLEDLAERLRRWLAGEPQASNVLVVGGGSRVDVIRRRQYAEIEAHWLAVAAMLSNARDLQNVLPEAKWFERIYEVRDSGAPFGILDPLSFMRYDDARHPLGPLPASWGVTSDSIAARAADMLKANELVLLKSALPPASAALEVLVAAGYVDPFFPHAAHDLACIRYVNLRHEPEL